MQGAFLGPRGWTSRAHCGEATPPVADPSVHSRAGAASEAARVYAVVVNYNGAAVTRACVDSLLRGVGPRVRVVIADNASAPEDVADLETAYGELDRVEIVRLAENGHFAAGVNAGVREALARGATHLFILNNDTVIESECVARLLEAARAAPEAGLFGPALLDLGDRRPLSLGERYSTWSLAVPRTLLKVRSTGAGEPYRVGGIMGSAVFATRACFEAVGEYDEDLRVYYEEVDYCLRARKLGYHPTIVPAAVVLHDGLRGFTAGITPYAAYLKCRNMLKLARRHGRLGDWILFLPVYAGLVATSAASYALRGNPSVVRAMFAGVRDGLFRRDDDPGPAW